MIWNTRGNGYYQTINSKILNQYQVGAFSDYAIVFLSINAHRKVCMVHRLVYQSFVGEIPDGMDVDHIDNDSTNNKLDNLKLMTKADNIRKSNNRRENWKYQKYSYKLIDIETGEERVFKRSGEISKLLGVTTYHIRNCALHRGTSKLIQGKYKVEAIKYIK